MGSGSVDRRSRPVGDGARWRGRIGEKQLLFPVHIEIRPAPCLIARNLHVPRFERCGAARISGREGKW
jgi:hypothetical protein